MCLHECFQSASLWQTKKVEWEAYLATLAAAAAGHEGGRMHHQLCPGVAIVPLDDSFRRRLRSSSRLGTTTTIGCQGCSCLHLSIHEKNMSQCGQCGKPVYELLDRLWHLRKNICRLFHFAFYRPRFVEYSIEAATHANMNTLKLGILPRAQLFDMYEEATRIVTDLVLVALAKRAVELKGEKPNPLDVAWWYEGELPLTRMTLLERRNHNDDNGKDLVEMGPKYEWRLTPFH